MLVGSTSEESNLRTNEEGSVLNGLAVSYCSLEEILACRGVGPTAHELAPIVQNELPVS